MDATLAVSNAVSSQPRERQHRGDLQQNEVTSLTEIRPEYVPAFNTITHLARLPHDWDTYGSPPLQASAIEGAILVLMAMQIERLPVPHITPVSGGGLNFEWSRNRHELEIEILPNGSVAYLKVDEAGDEDEGALLAPRTDELRDLMRSYRLAR